MGQMMDPCQGRGRYLLFIRAKAFGTGNASQARQRHTFCHARLVKEGASGLHHAQLLWGAFVENELDDLQQQEMKRDESAGLRSLRKLIATQLGK